jgi:FMN phosphatase YigB (HAD superfamily)
MPGALKLLSAITEMRDQNGNAPILALVSNFDRPEAEYFRTIEVLQIDKFFKPYEETITLSNVVGFEKPDKRIFRAAIDKIDNGNGLPFQNVIFVTEEEDHIKEARKLGMMTNRLKIPNDLDLEEGFDSLPEMIPFIHLFILI